MAVCESARDSGSGGPALASRTALPPYRLTALFLLLVILPPCRLTAQVGHDPQHSPFRDVTTRQALTPFISQFFGNRAKAGVGAQAALAVGGRFATALSGPLDLWITFAWINSRRNVIDPSKPVASRVSGPVDYRLVSFDAGLGLNLTGAKTWHALAPYAGVAFGIVSPTNLVTDPGGYRAGSNFTFVPTLGTRAMIGRSVSLTVEARDNFLRYEWPLQYFYPTDSNGKSLPPVLDPSTEKDKQMTHNFTLSVGLSYRFNF